MTPDELLSLACRSLERWRIDRLPFDPLCAARAEGIAVAAPPAENPSLLRGEACLLQGGRCPVILAAPAPSPGRGRWSLTHELAHFLAGEDEAQADRLCGLLLCPPAVLHLCASSAREVSRLCGVSAQAGAIAWEGVAARRRAGDFLRLPEERRCAERFLPFISEILCRRPAGRCLDL